MKDKYIEEIAVILDAMQDKYDRLHERSLAMLLIQADENRVQHERIAELSKIAGLPQLPESTDRSLWRTVPEAAFETGMSEPTVRLWVRQGKVAVKRIGGRVLVDPLTAPKHKKKTAR